MPFPLLEISLAFPVFALVLFRVGGLMLTAPVLSSPTIPRRIRGAFAMVLAMVLFPWVQRQAPAELTMTAAAVAGAGELMIGVTIGLSFAIMLMGSEIAGVTVGQQSAMALSQIVDPSQGAQSTVVGQFYKLIFLVVFLIAGGHRAMIAGLMDSYQAVPMLSVAGRESVLSLLIELLTAAFVLGIRLAGPVLIALFLAQTAMGFLSRTIPQLNILSVGFSLRILVALGVAGISLTLSDELLIDATWRTVELVRSQLGVG